MEQLSTADSEPKEFKLTTEEMSETQNVNVVTKRKQHDHVNIRSKSNLHESKYKRHSGGAIYLIEQTIKNSIHQSQCQNNTLFKSNSLSSLMNESFNIGTSHTKNYVELNANHDTSDQNFNSMSEVCKAPIIGKGDDYNEINNINSSSDLTSDLSPHTIQMKENDSSREKENDSDTSMNCSKASTSSIALININDSYESPNSNTGSNRRISSSQSSSSCSTTVVSEVTLGTINFGDYTNISKRFNKEVDLTCLKVPIVGYEVMEERARFTVYKLRLMTNIPGESWLLLRRYTDFVRLHCRLKCDYPDIPLHLPKKKWFGDNFHPKFLQDRVQGAFPKDLALISYIGLQEFVNTVLSHHTLLESAPVKDFLCLNDPPVFSECLEDSRALFEAQEETIMNLRAEIAKRDAVIADLKYRLSNEYIKNAHNHSILKNTKGTCEKCSKEINNTLKQFEDEVHVYTSTPTKADKSRRLSNKS